MTTEKVDDAVMQANEHLSKVFNTHVVLGRYETEEGQEEPYWCIAGNPLLGGDLLSWALAYLLRKALSGETFSYIDNDGERQEMTLKEMINKLETQQE